MRPLHDLAPGVSSLQDIVSVLAFLAVVFALFGLFLWRARQGRRTLVGVAAQRLGRLDGTPPWASLPPVVQTASLLLCGFGVWWDIAVHIDFGRDQGPFGTPAHYPIFVGLLGLLTSGIITAALAREPLPAGSLRLTPRWHLPPSAAVVLVCAAFSLAGFPLDDLWHRVFGVDVTLWGPTHLLMIGGVVLSMLSLLLLRAETAQVVGPRPRFALLDITGCGSLLIGIELFATEFDFGLPQFPLGVQPLLLVLAAALPLVLVRLRRGPGAALAAVGVYLAVRGAITLVVAVPLGRSLATFPLFLVEAAAVEGVVFLARRRAPMAAGLAAGAAVGLLGPLAEYAWSHVWSYQPWTPDMVPAMLVGGLGVGAGAGVVAAWLAARVGEVEGTAPARGMPVRRSHWYAALGLVAVITPMAVAVPRTAHEDVRGALTVSPRGDGTADVTVHVEPPSAALGGRWFTSVSWQGGGLVGGPMVRTGPGVYRTPQPVPVHGRWKSIIRLHRGAHDLTSLLVRMPADPAIGKPEVAAVSGTRPFATEQDALRREERPDLPAWAWTAGNGAMGVVALVELGVLALVFARAGAAGRALRRDAGAGDDRSLSLPRPGSRSIHAASVPRAGS